MAAAGFDLTDRLDTAGLPRKARERTLHQVGLRRGDVFAVMGSLGESHYELSGEG